MTNKIAITSENANIGDMNKFMPTFIKYLDWYGFNLVDINNNPKTVAERLSSHLKGAIDHAGGNVCGDIIIESSRKSSNLIRDLSHFAEKHPKAGIATDEHLTQCIEIEDYPEYIDINVSRSELELNYLLTDIELTMQGINSSKLAFLSIGDRDESKRNILKKKVQFLFDRLAEDTQKRSIFDKFKASGSLRIKDLIRNIESVDFNGKVN